MVTICCTCMVQGGGLSTGKGCCTINTRGRLDCATLFMLHGGRRRESCSRACCTARCRAGGEPMAGMAAAEAAPWLVVLSWGEMWMEEAQKSGSDRQPAGHPLGALRCVARQCAKNRLVTYQLKGSPFRSTYAPCCPVMGRLWSRDLVPRGTRAGTSVHPTPTAIHRRTEHFTA